MILKKLTIREFGKIHDRSLEFVPGINVLLGETDSDKAAIHAFVKQMLYGVEEQTKKGAVSLTEVSSEPQEDVVGFDGTLWLEEEGREYRLDRKCRNGQQEFLFVDETEGQEIRMEAEKLSDLLGGVSEIVYDNTARISRPASTVGSELIREIQNTVSGYGTAGDRFVDLGRAGQMLKMWRKGFQVQQDRRQKEVQKEQEKLSSRMDALSREMEELQDRQSNVDEKRAVLAAATGDGSAQENVNTKIEFLQKKRVEIAVGLAIAALMGIIAFFARLRFSDGMSRLGLDVCIVLAVGAVIYFMLRRDRVRSDLQRQRKMRARLMAQQEKLMGSEESIREICEEKQTEFTNLQKEYQEYETQAFLPTSEDMEMQALNLAMDTVEKLSGGIHRQMAYRLQQRTSRILNELTNGVYQNVSVDQYYHTVVNTEEETIPIERVDRSVLEQIYFALHMAAAELLCGDTQLPVVLDDLFGVYDERTLSEVLHWLEHQERQVILCAEAGREAEVLKKENIPYRLIKR